MRAHGNTAPGTAHEQKVKESEANGEVRKGAYYSRLYRKFVLITLVCSLVPLLIAGWAIHLHYTRIARDRMIGNIETQVDYHRRMIELFLEERSRTLHLISQTHSRESLRHAHGLARLFDIVNRESGSITDLGVIDDEGRHLAYMGPYELMDKNYSQTFWFKEVMERGFYVSDMFMGFRKVPHFVIAVAREEGGKRWILRATIDTEVFRSLVENVRIGTTGEVYLVNEEGVYQTSPRFSGKIMEKDPSPPEAYHGGTKIRTVTHERGGRGKGREQILATAWLREPRWMLAVKQDYGEAFKEVNHANFMALLFLHLCGLTILIVSVLSARHVVRVVRRRDEEAERLNRQIMETGKMASIGELSAGVAHEINNPLAIILTEKQILFDMAGCTPRLEPEFKSSLLDSLSQIETQVKRCKRITHNLLRFSRRTRSVIEEVDLNLFLREVVELMEREARSGGIRFVLEEDPELEPVHSDPSQLQQLFLNLITNAMDAHDGRHGGTIRITTKADPGAKRTLLTFSDTGSGIAKEHLDKIFDPFFTTKPVGKGTGLGLSICYAIIQRLGGTIRVESRVDVGTDFTLTLPYEPPPGLEASGTETGR